MMTSALSVSVTMGSLWELMMMRRSVTQLTRSTNSVRMQSKMRDIEPHAVALVRVGVTYIAHTDRVVHVPEPSYRPEYGVLCMVQTHSEAEKTMITKQHYKCLTKRG